MPLAAFLESLQKHGEDLTIWPEADRKAADLLLLESEAARDALAEMRVLRNALKSKPVKAPAHLTNRIMQAVSNPPLVGPVLTGTSHDGLPDWNERRQPR
jgi:hypothetical protein